MEANNVLNQLTFSESSPVKTVLLQQEHFGLARIALGKGVKIPPHQGGHAVFFLVLQGSGIFTCGEEDVELAQNQYLYIKADETRGIQALEELVVFAVTA
jgi:quercetin dioxygenase-like cupin family protein